MEMVMDLKYSNHLRSLNLKYFKILLDWRCRKTIAKFEQHLVYLGSYIL